MARKFGVDDPSFDACGVLVVGEAGADGGRDSARAPGRASHVGERIGEISSPSEVLNAVEGVGAQAHVSGIGAPGEVALVTNHGVLGAGPPEPRDHTVASW